MLTWLAYTHLVPPHILCRAKNIISLKQCNGLWFFVTLTFQWKWLEREPPLHIVNCLLVHIEDRGKWILQGSLSETSLWCTFSADFACITNFTIWEKNSHIKLPPFFIKSIICFVESLSESWCCLIIWIMSFSFLSTCSRRRRSSLMRR